MNDEKADIKILGKRCEKIEIRLHKEPEKV